MLLGEEKNEQFFMACKEGQFELVKKLWEEDKEGYIDINKRNKFFQPLLIASLKGHLDVVNYLLTLPKISVDGDKIETPLMGACALANTEDREKILVALIKYGADIRCLHPLAGKALDFAFERRIAFAVTALVDHCQEKDLSFSALTSENTSENFYQLIKELFDPIKKSNLNAEESNFANLFLSGTTPCYKQKNFFEMIQRSFELVKKPGLDDKNSNFADSLLLFNNFVGSNKDKLQKSTYKLFLPIKAFKNKKPLVAEKNEQFFMACKEGDLEKVKKLWEEDKEGDININKRANPFEGPLLNASFGGHFGVVEYLLKLPGIKVDGDNIATPLMLACALAKTEDRKAILSALLNKDADISRFSRSGKALDFAFERRIAFAVTALVDHCHKKNLTFSALTSEKTSENFYQLIKELFDPIKKSNLNAEESEFANLFLSDTTSCYKQKNFFEMIQRSFELVKKPGLDDKNSNFADSLLLLNNFANSKKNNFQYSLFKPADSKQLEESSTFTIQPQ